MPSHSITIDLSTNIYEEYQRRAEKHHRTLEAEIISILTKFVVGNNEEEYEEDGKLSPELQKLVDQLPFLDEVGLTRLAKSTFPKKEAARIESLHNKQKSEGLTDKEISDLAELMRKFDRWFVLRNAAAGLLFQKEN